MRLHRQGRQFRATAPSLVKLTSPEEIFFALERVTRRSTYICQYHFHISTSICNSFFQAIVKRVMGHTPSEGFIWQTPSTSVCRLKVFRTHFACSCAFSQPTYWSGLSQPDTCDLRIAKHRHVAVHFNVHRED